MYVVVQKCYAGRDEGFSISAIFGPYTSVEEANAIAELGNSKKIYANEFDVEQLELDLPNYVKNWSVKS